MGIFSMNLHQFRFASMFTSIGMFFLSGWFLHLCCIHCIDSPNQACWSPCTSIARPKSASFTAAPLLLLASRRFSGWKGKILVFLSTTGDGQDFAKKHQRTTPIESPEFLCNEICFNWCMAFFVISYCQKYFLTFCLWICFSNSLSDEIDQSL